MKPLSWKVRIFRVLRKGYYRMLFVKNLEYDGFVKLDLLNCAKELKAIIGIIIWFNSSFK